MERVSQGQTSDLVETRRSHRNEGSLEEANTAQELLQVSPSFSVLPKVMAGSPTSRWNKRP